MRVCRAGSIVPDRVGFWGRARSDRRLCPSGAANPGLRNTGPVLRVGRVERAAPLAGVRRGPRHHLSDDRRDQIRGRSTSALHRGGQQPPGAAQALGRGQSVVFLRPCFQHLCRRRVRGRRRLEIPARGRRWPIRGAGPGSWWDGCFPTRLATACRRWWGSRASSTSSTGPRTCWSAVWWERSSGSSCTASISTPRATRAGGTSRGRCAPVPVLGSDRHGGPSVQLALVGSF